MPSFVRRINRLKLLVAIVLFLSAFGYAGTPVREGLLYKFYSAQGPVYPSALIFDKAGKLYGTTIGGGNFNCSAPGCGTVFELLHNPNGSYTYSLLYSFQGGADGVQPSSPLIFDDQGNLYGFTVWGGNYSQCLSGCGTFFELSPAGAGNWTHTVLYNFTGGTQGFFPSGNMLSDRAGNIYATTQGGGNQGTNCGATGCGTVFKLSPNGGTWNETVLHIFAGGSTDGEDPRGLAADSTGNFYGVAQSAGSGCSSCGVAYEVSPDGHGGWTEKILHNFGAGADGREPYGTLAINTQGMLFGTTPLGGTFGQGTVYSLTPAGNGSWTEQVLYNFTGGADGDQPWWGVILNGNGTLFGTTNWGGGSTNCLIGCGTVFELNQVGGVWHQAVVYSFTGLTEDGAYPDSITLGPGPHLIGTTVGGGNNGNFGGDGVVFAIGR